MQVAQLVMMITCKPGQMTVVSSCQGWTWHLPRKSFMVILRSLRYPPQPVTDVCRRGGCRQLWSSRARLQKKQQRQRVNRWNGALYKAVPKAKICNPVYGCQYCSIQLSMLKNAKYHP